LEEALGEGTFREDLYYRINVFPIVLPPLRERRDDIPDLVSHFLRKYGVSKSQIEPEALACLMKYDWPGNVRELENVLERTLIMVGGGVVRKEDLPPQVSLATGISQDFDILGQGLRLEEVEKSLILSALRKSKGNKTKAAELLGVTRRRLYSMIQRLGVGRN
jgi:two-component system NtrC family response regulator